MTTLEPVAVYAAQRDTDLLAGVLAAALDSTGPDGGPRHRRILDLGTGSGALAVRAAARPGTEVTAVDVSTGALDAAREAARERGVALRVLLGDLVTPVEGEEFDLIVSNPPYVPAPYAAAPLDGPARAWDAGLDGRLVLDRLCRRAPRVLAPRGTVLIVQSALSGVTATRSQLEAEGLRTEIAARCRHPFGPVLLSRTDFLERAGLIEPGCRTEELVVIRAER